MDHSTDRLHPVWRPLVIAAIAAFALGVAHPALAHISYTGRNFGTVTTGTTITGQTVSSSFGWADATDGDWGDTHRTRVYRFTLSGTRSVAVTAQRVDLPVAASGTTQPAGTQTGQQGILKPGFSLFSGLSHTSSPLAHDHSSLSVEWLTSQFGTSAGTGLGGSGKEGSLNALGGWSIGNSVTDWPTASSGTDTLRSFSLIGYAVDGTVANFGLTPGLVGDGVADGFVTWTFADLAPGDYSLFVGGADYDAQLTETETFGPTSTAFPTYGLAVTVAPVPEPGTIGLVAAAAMVLLGAKAARHRRSRS